MSMNERIIGVDLGATNVRGAIVNEGMLSSIQSRRIHSDGSVEEVLNDIGDVIDPLIHNDVAGIGLGVPSVVDIESGVVYDVQYIPSWKEVPLKAILEKKYNVPVYVNNDANCFALGEYYFGKGAGEENMIGLAIGTGMGAGIIIHRRLYAGPNCGAGEFGMVDYLDHCFEYYCAGQFFENVHHLDGSVVFQRAANGDADSLSMYADMGVHLGNAMKMILYTYDPTLIVLGGSVKSAYPYFQETMWGQIRQFAYRKSLEKLRIEISELENSAILGAAALYWDAEKENR
jgi:glucokinase